MDIAEEFPALVRDDVMTLRPSAPDHWFPEIRAALHIIEERQRISGAVCWISDIKDKYGRLSVLYACTDPVIEEIIDDLEDRL